MSLIYDVFEDMNDFFYYFGPSLPETAEFLKGIFQRIELIENQYTDWLEYNEKQKVREQKELDRIYNVEKAKREKVLKRLIIQFPDVDRHVLAEKAFLDTLDYEFNGAYESLDNKFLENFDQYNKKIFNTIYSFVESKLKELCDIVHDQYELIEKPGCYNREKLSYLEKYLKYIERIFDLDLSQLNSIINNFRNVGTVRNKIVHEDSKITTNTRFYN